MIKPTTIFLGEKADRLFKQLASENEIAPQYFITKLILRDARTEATTLTSTKLKERLQLINEVEDELVELINNPPKERLAGRVASTKPKNIYAKVWTAHKRLEARGWSDDAIKAYCLDRYGMDIDIKNTPSKNPKSNPDWVGGGKVAQKIKKAQQVSRKIVVE